MREAAADVTEGGEESGEEEAEGSGGKNKESERKGEKRRRVEVRKQGADSMQRLL